MAPPTGRARRRLKGTVPRPHGSGHRAREHRSAHRQGPRRTRTRHSGRWRADRSYTRRPRNPHAGSPWAGFAADDDPSWVLGALRRGRVDASARLGQPAVRATANKACRAVATPPFSLSTRRPSLFQWPRVRPRPRRSPLSQDGSAAPASTCCTVIPPPPKPIHTGKSTGCQPAATGSVSDSADRFNRSKSKRPAGTTNAVRAVPLGTRSSGLEFGLVAHTGFEPVVSALRGRCPGPLDECAALLRIS